MHMHHMHKRTPCLCARVRLLYAYVRFRRLRRRRWFRRNQTNDLHGCGRRLGRGFDRFVPHDGGNETVHEKRSGDRDSKYAARAIIHTHANRKSASVVTIAVIGLGAMGSAALFHLARHGASVVGVEQFHAAHDRGSSHGQSRIIRQAYFEDDRYVPLLRRAYELWDELQNGASQPIWKKTGGVSIGRPDSALIAGTLRAATRFEIPHHVFEGVDAAKRFPAYRFRAHEVAISEPGIAALFPETCVAEHLRRAERCGAVTRFGVRVERIWYLRSGYELVLSNGEAIACDRLVIAGGPWTANFFDVPLSLERNVQHWFSMTKDAPEEIFLAEREGQALLYGFPDLGDGVKAAFHHSGETLRDPLALDRVARPDEIDAVRNALDALFAHPVGPHLRSDPCLYTNTPDEHFILGEIGGIVAACGFSGHGFKFSSVVGEILAQLALDGKTVHDISLFDPARFGARARI